MTAGNAEIQKIHDRVMHQIAQEDARLAALPKCNVCGALLEQRPCPACSERVERERQEIERQRALDIKRLGGIKAYEDFTLGSYDNLKVIKTCEGYPGINLYIWGTAGVGKTHLATAFVRQFPAGMVIKPVEIFRSCRGLKDGRDEQAAINKIIQLPYLVIDDLGVDKRTDFSLTVLYEIIDAWDMQSRKGLIVTSNLSLQALSERLGDDRIPSRLAGMCRVVEIGGPDRRILAAQQAMLKNTPEKHTQEASSCGLTLPDKG